MPIEESSNLQLAAMEEELEMTNIIRHYMLHGEQHIPVYQTVPINPKA